MKLGRTIHQPPGAPPPGSPPGHGSGAPPEAILFTVEPIITTCQGLIYRTERTTLLAKRVSTAQPLPQSPPLITEPADPVRYSLRREAGCWVLLFKNGRAYLKREIGLGYVACLLAQPDEPVPCARLFSRFSSSHRKDCPTMELPDPETGELKPVTDGVGMDQLRPDAEEVKARNTYYAKLGEYQKTAGDLSLPESERSEAQRAYEELRVFLKEHYRPALDRGRVVTKVVHKSIQRLCDHLREPMPGQKLPDAAATAFAEYIERHILLPSRRYTRARPGANVRIARGELAGRLIFECPPEDRWSVQV